MRDIASNIGVVPALAPTEYAAAANGLSVDRKGFEKVAFAVTAGTASGSLSFKVQDSDDGVTFADADLKYIIGEAPAAIETGKAYKLGYWGHKRYSRIALTGTGSAEAAAIAILSGAHARPVEG